MKEIMTDRLPEQKEGQRELLIRTRDPELLVQTISRRLSPSAEAVIALPDEMASQFSLEQPVIVNLEGENGSFILELQPAESLPQDIQQVKAEEGLKYLAEAAASTRLASEQTASEEDKKHLQGLTDNFTGAIGWLTNKAGEHKRKIINTVGAGIFVAAVTACGGEVQSTPTPESGGYPEPTAAEVSAEATLAPERVDVLNDSAQEAVDKEFEGLGMWDVIMFGNGMLEDFDGNQYALFTSKIQGKEPGKVKEFLLLGEISGNEVTTVRGLAIDENDDGPMFEFFGVSFNPERGEFVIEGELLRTSAGSQKVEIYRNGAWEELDGPDATNLSVQARLGQGVLAAPAVTELTRVPAQEATAVVDTSELPTRFDDEKAQQRAIEEFLEVSGYSSLEEAGEVLKGMSPYEDGAYTTSWDGEGYPTAMGSWGFIVGAYEISIEGRSFSGIEAGPGDRVLILLTYSPGLEKTVPYLWGGELDGNWFLTSVILRVDEDDPDSFSSPEAESFSDFESGKKLAEEHRGTLVDIRWIYSYENVEDVENPDNDWLRRDGLVRAITSDADSYLVRHAQDSTSLDEAVKAGGFAGGFEHVLDSLDPEQELGIIPYIILEYKGNSLIQKSN